MPSRIERSLKLAAVFFMSQLVACVVMGVMSIERLAAGDVGLATVLGGTCVVGVVWTVWSRYSNDGIYNPSRIHRRSKMR